MFTRLNRAASDTHVHVHGIPPEAAHFFSREKRELFSGVVVYFALSL